MIIKLGLYGTGKHGSRYLQPENTPEGCEVVVLPRDKPPDGVHGVIVATPPASHAKLAIEALRWGLPVLVEKPMALTWADAERMAKTSRQFNVPLLVAHTHLWAPEFQALDHDSEATIVWGGPERSDGSCPANLDWGPHAWSMALTLGTTNVTTGKLPERTTMVRTEHRFYDGVSAHRPMKLLVKTFVDLICGGSDERANLDFALKVQRFSEGKT